MSFCFSRSAAKVPRSCPVSSQRCLKSASEIALDVTRSCFREVMSYSIDRQLITLQDKLLWGGILDFRNSNSKQWFKTHFSYVATKRKAVY